MTVAVDTKPLRASSLRECARKTIYEGVGAPARERTPKEERIMWRGRAIGREYAILLANAHDLKIWVDSGPYYWVPPELRASSRDTAGLVCEKRVKWAMGVGHADIYIAETRTIVEVLSSAHASDAMTDSKLLQDVLYVEHDPEAVNGVLVILNPSDFTEERIVLSPASAKYAELRARMEVRVAEVLAWRDTGSLPGRVCGKPSEARSHFCQHAEFCFEGWTPPPLDVVAASDDLLVAVTEFEMVKRARKVLAAEDVTLERRQKDAQTVIEAAELPAGDVRVGPFKLTRTPVVRKPTFEWEKAEAAGMFDPAPVAEFFKPGASYSTYKAERVDHTGNEYGSEAPW